MVLHYLHYLVFLVDRVNNYLVVKLKPYDYNKCIVFLDFIFLFLVN